MPHQLVEDALGDPRNAGFLALASNLAYYDQARAAIEFQAELGLTAKLLSVGNTQAYVCTDDNNVVIAFRGTESPTSLDGFKDTFLTDAVNLLIVPEGRLGTDLAAAGVAARFHQGFVDALGVIWEPVYEATSAELKAKDRPLWITGHSLGGALATLSSWLFNRRFISVHQIYTFGAPMIGNQVACEAIDEAFPGRFFRFVNVIDPVPRLPTLSLVANTYAHVQKEIMLGAATAGAQAASAADMLGGYVSKTVDGVLSGTIIDDVWKQITERLSAHALDNYLNGLKEYKG